MAANFKKFSTFPCKCLPLIKCFLLEPDQSDLFCCDSIYEQKLCTVPLLSYAKTGSILVDI